MGIPELPSLSGGRETQGAEELLPSHFYAAYSFDQAGSRRRDIEALVKTGHQLGYPLRYWWLSDAVELRNEPDRLIVCAHHPRSDEDAGMDLYQALSGQGVTWDSLEAAAVEEYDKFGRPMHSLQDIVLPGGAVLFPPAESDRLQATAPPEDEPAMPAELTPNQFLVYYTLSGLLLTSADDAPAASHIAFAMLHALVGKIATKGLTPKEASELRLSELAIAVDSVEALEFPQDDQV